MATSNGRSRFQDPLRHNGDLSFNVDLDVSSLTSTAEKNAYVAERLLAIASSVQSAVVLWRREDAIDEHGRLAGTWGYE